VREISKRLSISGVVPLALAFLAGCASPGDQARFPQSGPDQPHQRHAELCNPDSLRWNTGFVPRIPDRRGGRGEDCVAVLDYVRIRHE
jgi:hypothetical protein